MMQRSVSICGCFAAGCALFLFIAAASAADLTGEQIFTQHCASCHGKAGEGVAAEYAEPLMGTRSIESLTKYIEKWMPEEKPKLVVGEDAKRVSQYIFDAFYSPVAQAKRNPPRVELSRLTSSQYRNTVADLLGSFAARSNDRAGSEDKPGLRGLRGEFFNGGRRFSSDRRVMDRIDAVVDFNFGEAGPGGPGEKVPKEEFAARWSGSFFAPETGEYEFIAETDNGVRLWINEDDDQPPLIDAWVRSGTDRRHSATIFLLGGRSYRIQAEIFKEKREKVSSLTLKWKVPHRVEELVPSRVLSPNRVAKVYVVSTPLPPDDRSMGYVRGTMVSKAWDEATTFAALEVADDVIRHLRSLAGRAATDGDAKDRLIDFGKRFAERAFRRPLTKEQQQFFVMRHFEGEKDLELAVKKVVLLALKSPRFLYHEAGTKTSDVYDIASRLSFGLWDSLPDDKLLEAAATGRLDSQAGILSELDRMMRDPRTKAKMREFFQLWLNLDRLHELAKDSKQYPDFNEAVISDLRVSLDLMLDEIMWSKESDFRQLMLADWVYMNGRLAKFYGVALPEGSDASAFQKVTLKNNAGILTHPLLMAGFAYDSTSSPIHRGVFVMRSLLGRRLRPPPEAVTPVPPDLHPDLSTRERIALQTKAHECMSCHSTINPLGFTLENFDAVGRYREAEKNRPIDAAGSYQSLDGDEVKFTGARELGVFLAASEEAYGAFVQKLFHHVVKQPVLAYGADRGETLKKAFVSGNFSMRNLLIETVAAPTTIRE
ncbi:MAG: DUF1592 domain-containing protein [Phycisphaeraceae bacterium]